MIGDYIRAMKRKKYLQFIGQQYADKAMEFRMEYSALKVDAWKHKEELGIDLDFVEAIFAEINKTINNHYSELEDLIINKGLSPEDAVGKVGVCEVQAIDLDEIERGIANGK